MKWILKFRMTRILLLCNLVLIASVLIPGLSSPVAEMISIYYTESIFTLIPIPMMIINETSAYRLTHSQYVHVRMHGKRDTMFTMVELDLLICFLYFLISFIPLLVFDLFAGSITNWSFCMMKILLWSCFWTLLKDFLFCMSGRYVNALLITLTAELFLRILSAFIEGVNLFENTPLSLAMLCGCLGFAIAIILNAGKGGSEDAGD